MATLNPARHLEVPPGLATTPSSTGVGRGVAQATIAVLRQPRSELRGQDLQAAVDLVRAERDDALDPGG